MGKGRIFLKPDYLAEGYFDQKGYLRKEIFTTEAVHVADVLADRGMKNAALRRFYAKLRGIDNRFLANGDFNEVQQKLYSFHPDVAYAVGRKVVPPEFQNFIDTNIKLAVKGANHFKGFIDHFQSVVAYFKEQDSRNRR